MGTIVKTEADCFVNGRRYRPGDVFELPEGMVVASWMVKQTGSAATAKPKAKKKVAKKVTEPETFSELAKIESEALGPDVSDLV
jgi:hypothetical protein